MQHLEPAWQYHTGDLPETIQNLVAFEDHPTLIEGNLIVCSTKRRVIALDPATGEERWRFDSGADKALGTQKCRGIATWRDPAAPVGTLCASRILLGTNDYRLAAIDAATGEPCRAFGDNGVVAMPVDKPERLPGEISAGSNPAVVNGVVVVGSAIIDLLHTDRLSGRILAFDARTGEYRWQFDPVPRDPSDSAMSSWGKGTDGMGQGNVWSSMAVDEERDLVFLPTTSATDDYYGGERPHHEQHTLVIPAQAGIQGGGAGPRAVRSPRAGWRVHLPGHIAPASCLFVHPVNTAPGLVPSLPSTPALTTRSMRRTIPTLFRKTIMYAVWSDKGRHD